MNITAVIFNFPFYIFHSLFDAKCFVLVAPERHLMEFVTERHHGRGGDVLEFALLVAVGMRLVTAVVEVAFAAVLTAGGQ